MPPQPAAAPQRAGARARRHWLKPGQQAPDFGAISSKLTFGVPTDISMGWDGTLWAIDKSGAPHLYDPTEQQWQLQGSSISAAAVVPDNSEFHSTLYLFRGGEFVTVAPTGKYPTGAPKTIAEQWPHLPDTFKMGVVGATWGGYGAPGGERQSLFLFNGGRYVSTDEDFGPPLKLTDLSNWPQTPNWKDGVIDGVFARVVDSPLFLLRGGELISVDLRAKTVLGPPQPLSQYFSFFKDPALSPWASGLDAMAELLDETVLVFKGPVVGKTSYAAGTGATLQYIGNTFAAWPVEWNPVLLHAPSGRVGDLWAVGTDRNFVLRHSGELWARQYFQADNVATGQDGTVMIASAGGIWRWDESQKQVNKLADLANLIQVEVGNATTVWGRCTDNTVYSFDTTNNAFNPATIVGAATDIAANADGTLWHCHHEDPNAYRFISEATLPSAKLALGQATVTGVQKLASTGFGAAHCLAQLDDGSTQVYRYDSPYLFKTSQSYVIHRPKLGWGITSGLGNLYFVATSGDLTVGGHWLVAVDAHTGREGKRLQLSANLPQYAQYDIVFDPVNELVYVGCKGGAAGPGTGRVLALDARDLTVRWTYLTKFVSTDPRLALNGTQLCFPDDQNILYMFDTRDALAQTKGGGGSPKPRWTWRVSDHGIGYIYGIMRPLLANGQVYAAVWSGAGTYTLALAQCNADDGSNPQSKAIASEIAEYSTPYLTPAPVLGRVRVIRTADIVGHSEPQALYISGMQGVYVVNIETDAEPVKSHFSLPGSVPGLSGFINTGLAYDDGTRLGQGLSSKPDFSKIGIWFGDSNGNLWALDDGLQADAPAWQVHSDDPPLPGTIDAPVIYKDPQGGATVLFGVYDFSSVPALYGYDVATGNVASIPTGTTFINAVTPSVTNGIIYAGGGLNPDYSNAFPPQLFGIRVDELPQVLRSFVIESQLMQDPDQNATASGSTDPNNPIPPSVARYQTHLTVLDGSSNDPNTFGPRPNEPVKVWADKPGTTITIDTATGPQKFTVGPGDNDYAAVTTGTDGSLVIVSDATDMFASPLRVWASFMDPYERIVVNPDQEFHARVTTAHADANNDDPDKVNLATAQNYKGDPLFTQDEKNHGQPKNCADAVGQMNKGVGFGGGSKSSHANILRVMRGERPAAATALRTAGPEPYLAYADLTSASHFPTNIPAARPVGVVAHVGLSYSRPLPIILPVHPFPPIAPLPPVQKTLSHSEALDVIDQLDGDPWQPPPPTQSSSAAAKPKGDIWSDFWKWLTGWVQDAVNYISAVVVAVAEDIVVGIQMVVDGVTQVFKAIIKTVEDIASAIGSFFQMLAKWIEDVIAALSVLFHFGEIIKTHLWLRDQIKAQVVSVKSAITEYVLPGLDNFFKGGEDTVKHAFDELRQQIKSASVSGSITSSGSLQLNNLPGSGSSAHTAFAAKAGGIGPDSGGSSHAVQATWGHQKLKSGLPAAKAVSRSVASSRTVVADDPLSNFLTGFVDRITGDGDLNATFSQLQTDFGHLLQPNSAGDFFATLLDTFLDILEVLLLGTLAVSQAFVGGIDETGKPYGLLSLAGDLIDTVMDLLTGTIEIPVLSWLYKLLFNEDLTFLNAITLVAAIPATMLYRVVAGRYPSADFPKGLDASAHGEQRAEADSNPLKVLQGVFGGLVAVGLGIVRGLVDASSLLEESVDVPKILPLGLGLVYGLIYYPAWFNDPSNVGGFTWAGWGAGIAIALIGVLPIIVPLGSKELWDELKPVVLATRSSLAVLQLFLFIGAFFTAGNTNATSDVTFARNLALPLPPWINLLTLGGVAPTIVVVVVDVVVGCVVAALGLEASVT